MNSFHKKIVVPLLCCLPLLATAQDEPQHSQILVSPGFELLRSTHHNFFYAPSVKVNRHFNNGLEPGLGLEYATTPLHHDNGYTLYRLKFLPIYGNLKYHFTTAHRFGIFAETSLGLSFNRYDISDDTTPNLREKVSEQGFYTYLGFGAKYKVTKGFDTFAGIGFKGYKMSTNDLDINPHGLSFAAGFSFY